jgi:Mg-chelatase subunit ChlD
VAKALALFGKGFREATPQRMLEIARELRRIFSDETAIGDALSLHGAATADPGELAGRLPGISDDDLSAEIDSIRQRPSERAQREKGSRGQGINRSDTTEFAEIEDVVVLEVDRDEYRKLAQGVAGWSRRLRRFLETLGVSRVTLRRRTAGSAVDRAALPRAITRGDPRILLARRNVLRADLFLGVVIDCSGSMARAGSMTRAQLFAALIAEAARGLNGIDARFFGFTDSVIYDAGTADHCAVAELEPGGGNNDAAALWYASRVAMTSRRSARLLVMISDGAPTECSVSSLRALVSRLTAGGIACAQVAVQPIDEVCFPDYVLVDDEDLSQAVGRFGRIIVRLVRKVT